MSELTEPITPAQDPFAGVAPEALQAAFAEAKPYNPAAEPAAPLPVEPAPVALPPAAPATEPVTPAEAPEPATPAVDYAAWTKETFGVDSPEAIKAALEVAKGAEALKANQRTPQDVAFDKLLADPAAATQFVKLQTTDFTALAAKNPQKLYAMAYAVAHPELPADLAKLEAKLEYEAKFGAASFDDPDDPQVKIAKTRLDYAMKTAVAQMEQVKTEAKAAVLRDAPSPVAEGPSAEEIAASEARSNAWLQSVEAVTGAPEIELSYDVDGQKYNLAFDNKTPEFKEAMLAPVEFLLKEIGYDEKTGAANYDRLAEIVALIQQPHVLLKHAAAVGKSSVGAVLPLDTAVNPIAGAPQAPAPALTLEEAIRQSVSQSRPRNNQY